MHTFYYPKHHQHEPAQLHQDTTPDRNAYYAEVAARGYIIYEAVKEADLGPISTPVDFGFEPIEDVHDPGLLNFLEQAYERFEHATGQTCVIPDTFNPGRPIQHKLQSPWGLLGQYCYDTSSPIFEQTWEAAYWSAQTALSAAALLVAGTETAAYALCRPPGHHATANQYGGFCYLNNAAIAAHWLVRQGQRVAILDVDYHHGNGTQMIFYGRSDVLFCSLHANPIHEYPYYWGYADEFGVDAGDGYNFNFPLPLGTAEPAYLDALEQAFIRIRAYVPDALIVSLGVDTAENDPVGGFKLTSRSFNQIGQQIASLGLPTLFVQEGGYLLPTLGDHVTACLHGFTYPQGA